ncbi:MAG: ATP-binding protein, partial [Planctomycetota bacterium]
FRRDVLVGVINAHLQLVPPEARERNEEISPFLSGVIDKLLSKDPEERFDSAAELRDVLAEGEGSDWWAERELAIYRQRGYLPDVPVRRETPVYGRDAELDALRAAWEGTVDGRGGILLLEGEAGIGKTRLVDLFLLELEGADIHALYGSYPPSGGMGGLSDAILHYFGRAGLEDGLAPYLTPTPSLIPAFAAMVRHEGPPDGCAPVEGEALQAVLCHLMRGLADERPLLWVVDDLHFSPAESRKLVLSLARAVEGHRVLLVLTTRPGLPEDEVSHLSRLAGFRRLALGRLGARQVIELLRDAFRSEMLADRLGASIAYKSDGVPFFVFEMIRGLKEGQFISELPDGTYVETRVVEDIEVPSAVRDLIEARLRGLADEDRNLLDVAAVAGFEFEPEMVAEVLEMRLIKALQRLAAIERRSGVVRSGPERYRFDHHQIQEVLYGDLPAALRTEYHSALAGALAARGGEERTDGEAASLVAFHHLRGSRPGEAIRYLETALDHLSRSYRNDAALDLMNRALDTDDLLEGGERVDVLLRKAELLELTGRREEGMETLDLLSSLADESVGPARRGQVRLRLGRQLVFTAQTEPAMECLGEALDFAREAGDGILEASALGLLGNAHYVRGNYEEARERYERQLAVSEAAGYRLGVAGATGSLANLASIQGRHEEARALYERTLAAMREIGERRGEVTSLGNLATLYTRMNRQEDAKGLYEQALRTSREIGYRRGEAIATGNLGTVLSHHGLDDAARRNYERYLAISREIGDAEGESNALVNMGGMLVKLGDEDEAKRCYEESRKVSGTVGARLMEAYAVHGLGNVALLESDLDGAEARFNEALSLWSDMDFGGGVALAKLSLGRVCREAGRTDEALSHVEDALAKAREMGSGPSICQASALLCQLDPDAAASALESFEEHKDSLGQSERMEISFLLHVATKDPEHLEEAHRLLVFRRDRAPEEHRETMIANVPLHREILEAWEDRHGDS